MISQEWILIGLASIVDGASFYFLKRICLLVFLCVIAVIDWKEYRIPNKSIIVGIWIKFLITIFEIVYQRFVIKELFMEMVAAMVLFLCSIGCRTIKKNSIGAGDVKLLFLMALYLGWNEIWAVVFISFLVFIFMAIVLMAFKKEKKRKQIPMGAAFALGTGFVLIYNNIFFIYK